jgi:hypothetical protein
VAQSTANRQNCQQLSVRLAAARPSTFSTWPNLAEIWLCGAQRLHCPALNRYCSVLAAHPPQYLAKANPSPATKGHKSPVSVLESRCLQPPRPEVWLAGRLLAFLLLQGLPACLTRPCVDLHVTITDSAQAAESNSKKRCSRHPSIRSRPQQWMPLCVLWSAIKVFHFSAVPGAVCRATSALTQSIYKTMS